LTPSVRRLQQHKRLHLIPSSSPLLNHQNEIDKIVLSITDRLRDRRGHRMRCHSTRNMSGYIDISQYNRLRQDSRPEMNFSPGQLLQLPELSGRLNLNSSEFRVQRVLKGGMGECICLAHGAEMFALKLIRREITENEEAWERYRREMRLWVTLSACDGIVEALCLTRVNEIPAVCSRWMHGGNLRPYLRTRTPELFFSVMARIVGTLRWAYEQHNVIHRDLKPDNILLDESGLAYVSDWGLARPLTIPDPSEPTPRASARQNDPKLTAAGRFLGTVSYASPEQLLGVPDLDHRTDIYSLGCLMYEWESGKCPFGGVTAEEIYLKHLFEAPRALGGFFKRTAFGTEEVIHACLEKDPRNRPSDYASLNAALAQAASTRGIQYASFFPQLRYEMPMVGAQQYHERLLNKGVLNNAGTYAVVEQHEIEPFLKEAQALTALGDHRKAEEIYASLFVPDMATAAADDPLIQHVAINYANCLIELGRYDEAIAVLQSVSGAKEKPAEYFVNLSLAQIRTDEYRAAGHTAAAGLRLYPDDHDLIGNLLTAQTALGAFAEAAETAKIRLSHKRDVHSLHEVAVLHCKYADTVRDLDWPLAIKNYKYAVSLLREAKDLNPRYLAVRIQLAITLEALTAYGRCTDELAAAKDLPFHFSDRVFMAYLFARCLDRVNDHKGCWEFCNKWLAKIAELEGTHTVPRNHIVRLERVRAITIADGYCIGQMKDGQRVIAPVAAEFFAQIVHDERLREAGDFCFLARLHEWMEEYDRAYSVLSKGQSLYRKYWEIPFQRAAFLMRSGNYGEASGPAEEATALAPWKPQTWKLLANVHSCLGSAVKAAAAEKRAEEVQRIRDLLAGEIESALALTGKFAG
jgi:serine/threonine protein kinase